MTQNKEQYASLERIPLEVYQFTMVIQTFMKIHRYTHYTKQVRVTLQYYREYHKI